MKKTLALYALLVALLVLTTIGIALDNTQHDALPNMQTVALD